MWYEEYRRLVSQVELFLLFVTAVIKAFPSIACAVSQITMENPICVQQEHSIN